MQSAKSTTSLSAKMFSVFFGLVVFLSLFAGNSAWRPQGRFGKRVSVDNSDSAANIDTEGSKLSDTLQQLASLRDNIRVLDTEVFEADGVVCLSTAVKGHYKCFRYDENTSSLSKK